MESATILMAGCAKMESAPGISVQMRTMTTSAALLGFHWNAEERSMKLIAVMGMEEQLSHARHFTVFHPLCEGVPWLWRVPLIGYRALPP
jgi:hypothetical protein